MSGNNCRDQQSTNIYSASGWLSNFKRKFLSVILSVASLDNVCQTLPQKQFTIFILIDIFGVPPMFSIFWFHTVNCPFKTSGCSRQQRISRVPHTSTDSRGSGPSLCESQRQVSIKSCERWWCLGKGSSNHGLESPLQISFLCSHRRWGQRWRVHRDGGCLGTWGCCCGAHGWQYSGRVSSVL